MGWGKSDYENVAGFLARQAATDVALVPDAPEPGNPTNIFFTVETMGPVPKPRSAITDLIQAVNERDSPTYRMLEVSRTIYCTSRPNTMDTEMARMNRLTLKKVTKKTGQIKIDESDLVRLDCPRWHESGGLGSFDLESLGPPARIDLGSNRRFVDRIYMAAAFSLIVARFTLAELENRGGNIGALLVDETGSVLAWPLNTKDKNSTCHAEVNLLQSYFYRHQTPVPPHCTVYTTLKPCRMCAGMISHATDQKVAVVYGQDDSGPDATGTTVDKAGVGNLLGDPEYASEPIMIESDFGGRAAVMAYRLGRYRRQYRGTGGIVEALASQEITLTMVDAMGALERIYQAAGDATERSVLGHLWPFLRDQHATLDTIPG